VVDYNLYQTDARREDIDYVEETFRLLRQATEAIERRLPHPTLTTEVAADGPGLDSR
jgi:hypothetical protein